MADNVLHLKPAYGRSYETVELLMKDWNEGKDFMIIRGPYCSIRNVEQMKEMGFRALIISSSSVVKQGTFSKILMLEKEVVTG